jgi:plasmid stabilization system protein ParE
MAKKIIFSPEANERLKEIIFYLVNEWSIDSANKFIDILESKLSNIKKFPLISPKFEDNPEIHYCVINKQITLYYRISESDIEVITLFDSRRNPANLVI